MVQLIAQAQAQAAAQMTPTPAASNSEVVFLWLALMVSFITAIVLAERIIHCRILPYQPRRQVPWGGADVLWIFLVVFMLYAIVGAVLHPLMIDPAGPTNTKTAVSKNIGSPITTIDPAARPINSALSNVNGTIDDKAVAKHEPTHNRPDTGTAHPVVSIVRGGSPWMIAFCVLATVILAPVAEEFFFRLLLQGWLEKIDARSRRRLAWLVRLPRGLIPILLVSSFFGLLHFRTGADDFDVRLLIYGFTVQAIGNLLGLIFGVFWLAYRGAKPADFGWDGAKTLLDDILRGIFTFFLIAGPIYGLQLVMTRIMHSKPVVDWLGVEVAADPIAIIFFSIALGILYFRTHRLTAAITLHIALNLTSIALLAFELSQYQ